jgi:VanZ family protein
MFPNTIELKNAIETLSQALSSWHGATTRSLPATRTVAQDRAMITLQGSRWQTLAVVVPTAAAIATASLIPAKMQMRLGLNWLTEHFLVYCIAGVIFSLVWKRPVSVALSLALFAGVLEALQGFTPDRVPDLPTALAGALGALSGVVAVRLVLGGLRFVAAGREASGGGDRPVLSEPKLD